MKNLKDREWSTLSVELLVLVVGVFLGIQAANWNDARRDREDERDFLRQLRVDIISAQTLSNQIGRYRVEHREHMESALDVLFGRSDRSDLTSAECQAVHTSGYVNMPFIDIGSFDELSSSGRIDIIRDQDLRASLLRLQQAIAQSNRTVELLSGIAFPLAANYPDLIELDAVVDRSRGRPEVRTMASCDTAKMRASREFLNRVGSNIDLYDAFFRDGFEPWQLAIAEVSRQVDALVEIELIDTALSD